VNGELRVENEEWEDKLQAAGKGRMKNRLKEKEMNQSENVPIEKRI
jgi:hypothetical protein